ncbi:MAG: hypothetical protein AAFV95_01000 [Bacteroidota bacterium]
MNSFSINGKSLLSHFPAVCLLLAVGWMGYTVHQEDFYSLLLCMGISFGAYYWICFREEHDHRSIRFYCGLGILLRLSLLFVLPLLSDDIYRFVWDGRLINQGINPFEQLPSYYIEQGGPPGLDQALFDQLNSPEYFTIYPPICQAIFATACRLFPTDVGGASMVMKAVLIAMEIGSIYLISRLLTAYRLPAQNVLFYALNPLMIIEISGNLHFEGAMVFFLVLTLWLLWREAWMGSAVAMALSIASKLLPLLFLPLLLRFLGWKKSIQYYLITGLIVSLLFLPLLSGSFLDNFGNSLDLYFRKFEFNASLYYVLRWLGYQLRGYNLIALLGPALALIVFSSILWLSFRREKEAMTLPHYLLFAISIYLLCATTVHPWYVSLPVVLCCFTHFRYPILWSALIGLTYVNYSYETYVENLWVVAIEYSLVLGFFLWEWRTKSMETS